MSEYLILAENITFKNNRLSCINIYDRFSSVALPAEFVFDLAVICGPNWTVGEHKLTIKAKANNGIEVNVGELSVNIPSEKFVYNAYAQDLKIKMDYSVQELTFVVVDGDKEIISRAYPVVPMLVPQQAKQPVAAPAPVVEEVKTEKEEKKATKKEKASK